MSEVTQDSWENSVFPQEIGAAVIAHCLLNRLNGDKAPNPNNPYEVLDVARTVLNHTEIEPDELAVYIPVVRTLLTVYAEEFGTLDT